MPAAPKPADEDKRLQALIDLDVLDTLPEPEFDALVRAAALICDTPISLISLVDKDRQWFKANTGLPGASQTPRDVAFCAHAILGDQLLEIPDASADARFADNGLVTDEPNIRFYAGAPLQLSSGEKVGTLCVIDRQARQLTSFQREAMGYLAQATVKALEGRLAVQRLGATLEALRHRESRLSLIVDNSPSMMAYWDRDLTCVFANNMYETWFGVDVHWMVGKPLGDVLGAEIFALNKPYIDGVLAGKPQAFERMIPGPDGISRHGLVYYTPDVEQGQVIGFLSQVNDVSALKLAEQTLREAQRLGCIGSWEWSPQTDTVTWSAELYHLLGQDPTKPAPCYSLQATFYSPESWARLHPLVQRAVSHGEPYSLEMEFVRPDGTSGWIEARGEASCNPAGQVIGLRGTVQDITTRRKLLAELAEQHELLSVTLHSIGDAVITTDAAGVVTWLNPVAEKIAGMASNAAKGCPLDQVFSLLDEETGQPSAFPLAHALQHSQLAEAEKPTVLIVRNGQQFCIEVSAAPIAGPTGQLQGAVLVLHDVTEQRRQSKEITYRAQHDSLTGLVNRAEFEARLHRALAKTQAEGCVHTLICIDMDQFKIINDTCGHAAGDRLLQNVANLFTNVARATDTVARLGGDEFAVLLEHCTRQNAEVIAQQICNRLDESRFVHEGKRFRVSASIGLVPIDGTLTTPIEIMQAADRSCYAAKEAGRNRVHTWFEEDENLRARHSEMQWATRLENAFDEERFRLYAQRILPLGDGKGGNHLEVLLRLVESDGTVISPGAFFSAAERFNMATRIDRLVLRKAVDQLLGLPTLANFDTICVNISGQSVSDRAFHREAISILSAAGPAVCQCICLEITETVAITNLTEARHFIEQVKRLGLRIALDDFGAGAATFGYLKSLPINILKIDGQFVRNLVTDPLDEAAMRCFVDVARIMGVKLVAECVETEAVLVRLRELGVHYAQGYLLHRPEPIENVLGSGTAAQPTVPIPACASHPEWQLRRFAGN
jgi:diguanylate cyclase (GGDEF)-like protein/PAS domain S-box-containing protein